LSNVEIAQRSTRGSFALFAGNFLSAVISFAAILFIARLLGPSDYGVYTLSVLVPTILLNFLGFGVNSGITRYAAYNLSQAKPEVARRMAVNGAAFVMLFGVFLAGVDYLAARLIAETVLHRPDIAPLLRFSSILILAQAVFQSGVAALLGWSYMGKIAGTNIVQSGLRLAIAVPLLYLGYEVYGALAGYAVSVALGGILAYSLLWGGARGGAVSLGQFVPDVRTLLSYGRELFVGSLVTSISAQYVVLLLAVIATNSYVGFYQSAANFLTAITLVSGAITQALFPAFAHLEGTKSDVDRAFRYATKYMGFAITPIIFLLMGASLQIVRLPLGSSYATASNFLALLSLSNISLLFGLGVLPSFFNGLGRPRYYMVYSLAGAAVIFALAPLLSIGAGLGVDGLILSILAANLVAVVTGLYLASRFFNARVDLRACLLILTSSLLAYVAVVAVSTLRFGDIILLPAEILVFVAVYLTAAPLLRVLGPEDLDTLQTAVSGLGRFQVVIQPILRYERFVLRASKSSR
jgi:O-antigen/teichoic acid export membrane protein